MQHKHATQTIFIQHKQYLFNTNNIYSFLVVKVNQNFGKKKVVVEKCGSVLVVCEK